MDKSIASYPIAMLARKGKNDVEMHFSKRGARSAEALDSENEIDRNLFTFDLEIENIYITGSFSVDTAQVRTGSNTLSVNAGNFRIVPEKPLACGELTQQGLWFYRGEVAAEFCLPDVQQGERIFLQAESGGQICCRAECEGRRLAVLCGDADRAEVSGCAGKTVRLILTLGNRNLLGPHHHAAGDPIVVGGNTFRGVRGFEDEWAPQRYLQSTARDEYHFVRCVFTGVRLVYR